MSNLGKAAVLIKALVGQTPRRIAWENTKAAAKTKGINTKIFNKNLGPAIDAFTNVAINAFQMEISYGKQGVDMKPLKTRATQIGTIVDGYVDLIDPVSEKPEAQKNAWIDLKNRLNFIKGWAKSISEGEYGDRGLEITGQHLLDKEKKK